MIRWRRLRLLALALTLPVVVGVGVSAAASQPTLLVPGGQSVAGRNYAQWVHAAVRWTFSQPLLTTNSTSCFTAGQRGRIWFLAEGVPTSSVITTTCAVPAGRYLMLLGSFADCSTVEPPPFHATTNAGLMRCARAQWRRARARETVTLDGVDLKPPAYGVGTPAFKIPGGIHGRIAVDVLASILRPLSPGTHTLVQISSSSHPALSEQITYQLTVG